MSERAAGGAEHPDEKVSRRTFMKKLGALGASAGPTILGLELGTIGTYVYRHELLDMLLDGQHEGDESIGATKLFLREEYGIEVRFGLGYEDVGIEGAGLGVFEARQALSALVIALNKYPRDFFRINRLPAIRIARNLETSLGEKSARSQSGMSPVGGLAPNNLDEILIGYQVQIEGMERTFHHELYHQLDRRDDRSRDDAYFEGLMQSCGQQYTNDFSNMSGSRPLPKALSELIADPEGAVNPGEDRATIAERLMSVVHYVLLVDRAGRLTDPRFAAAFQAKIRRIKDNYLKWSQGRMGEEFWLRMEREGRGLLQGKTGAQGTVDTWYDSRPSYSDWYDYGPVVDRHVIGAERYDSYYSLSPEEQRARDRQFVFREFPNGLENRGGFYGEEIVVTGHRRQGN